MERVVAASSANHALARSSLRRGTVRVSAFQVVGAPDVHSAPRGSPSTAGVPQPLLPSDLLRRAGLSPSPPLPSLDAGDASQWLRLINGDAAVAAPSAAAVEADGQAPLLTAAEAAVLLQRLEHLTAEVSRLSQRVTDLEGASAAALAAAAAPAAALPAPAGADAWADTWAGEVWPAPAGEEVEEAWLETTAVECNADADADADLPWGAAAAGLLDIVGHVVWNGLLHTVYSDPLDGAPLILAPRRTELADAIDAGARPVSLPATAADLLAAAAAGKAPGVAACGETLRRALEGHGWSPSAHGDAPLTVDCGEFDRAGADSQALPIARKYALVEGHLAPVYESSLGQFVSIPSSELCDGRIAARVVWLTRNLYTSFEAVYLRVADESEDTSHAPEAEAAPAVVEQAHAVETAVGAAVECPSGGGGAADGDDGGDGAGQVLRNVMYRIRLPGWLLV